MEVNDLDLDVYNFEKTVDVADSGVFYIRMDGGEMTYVLACDGAALVDSLLTIKDLEPVLLTAASIIVKDKKITWNEFKKFSK